MDPSDTVVHGLSTANQVTFELMKTRTSEMSYWVAQTSIVQWYPAGVEREGSLLTLESTEQPEMQFFCKIVPCSH